MWHKSIEQSSVEELEALVRQRRAEKIGQPMPVPSSSVPVSKRDLAHRRRAKWWDKALYLTALVVIAGIVLIFGISARGWQALRQQLPVEGVSLISEQALTASPAKAAELAGKSPIGWNNVSGDQGVASQAEPQSLKTPEHLKRWLEPVSATPPISIPPAEVQAATRIVIPSIGVDAPIGEGIDWEALKYKVGHYPGTAQPGQRGNMVLAAHNDIYGEIFRYLPDVPVGEVITIYGGEATFTYRITDRKIITPDQVEVMLPTTGPTTTLISCYPYLIDTHRIVLFGELVG